MNSEKFGVGKVLKARHCSMFGCRKLGTTFIGDKDHPYLRSNFYLCDEHLNQVYKQLQNQLGIEKDNTNGQELTNKYLEMLYNSGGMTNKEKLKEFCTENGIELPKDVDELKTKGYMELIFPEVLVKEGEE